MFGYSEKFSGTERKIMRERTEERGKQEKTYFLWALHSPSTSSSQPWKAQNMRDDTFQVTESYMFTDVHFIHTNDIEIRLTLAMTKKIINNLTMHPNKSYQ